MTGCTFDDHFTGPLTHPAMPAFWTVIFMSD